MAIMRDARMQAKAHKYVERIERCRQIRVFLIDLNRIPLKAQTLGALSSAACGIHEIIERPCPPAQRVITTSHRPVFLCVYFFGFVRKHTQYIHAHAIHRTRIQYSGTTVSTGRPRRPPPPPLLYSHYDYDYDYDSDDRRYCFAFKV